MKYFTITLFVLLLNSTAYSQAREENEGDYKTYYVILVIKDGDVKQVIKEGKGITAKINDKFVTGRWYYKADPDEVVIIGKNGLVIGSTSLNKQKSIKLEVFQPRTGGMSVGFGFGPVGVSTGTGGGGTIMQPFNMNKYQITFDKQKETKEEKIRREYKERKEQEQLAKEAAKKAKKEDKEAKKAKKK
jgi:hypothetical protein